MFLMSIMLILGACSAPGGAANAAPSGAQQKAAPSPAVISKEDCLKCHGPFEKLATASPSYVAPSGEKIVPHRFVPHNSKEAKAIPGCDNCHEPHAVPPTGPTPGAPPKADVQWCYTTCHHKNNFALCKDCHK
jgi:hypothetical protein